MLSANEIRQKFLKFFEGKGHKIIKSDSVVPKEDPTVLFTTAGMQQFKRQFLGHIDDYTRAATSQKCLRTDDLQRVGTTNFHHTFFEMLGNFSFGDYFKAEAIPWAWEFLTKEMQLPAEKLWVSIYKDDDEAMNIWLNEVKIPKNKLIKLGDKSNFWPSEAKQKGPNGPCGPCSEIFYDYGINPDCPKGDKCDPDCDCGRFSEVWNLVFTQFNRKDGGELEPLPGKNIDTGMGLERLVAVVQGKRNNFETDLFAPIIEAIDEETERGPNGYTLGTTEKRIIADHIRAIVFAIGDGVMPSNKGRGSVIKRLINDATDLLVPFGKYGKRLYKLVPAVVDIMAKAYPDLEQKSKDIQNIIHKVQDGFLETRNKRIPQLKEEIIQAQKLSDKDKIPVLGKIFFNYRDTYGLTTQTIIATAQELGISGAPQKAIMDEYEKFMQQQQDRSRASSKMAGDVFADADLDLSGLPKTDFDGYYKTQVLGKILRLFNGNEQADEVTAGDNVTVILDSTSFYGESGGQIGDTGFLTCDTGKIQVQDTIKIGDVFLHIGQVKEGKISSNSSVATQIDVERRLSIMRNHTATHLLQAALREVLGAHVQQQGSVVDAERLRFDFSHPKGLSSNEIRKIEDYVFHSIIENAPVSKEVVPIEEAKKRGALAFFAEKYGESVRVVSVKGYSRELCGGTHLDSTGQIGLFKIISESAIAQGIRRIEAKTGTGAFELMTQKEATLDNIARLLKSPVEEVAQRIETLSRQVKKMEKELGQYRFEVIKNSVDSIMAKAETIHKAKVITHIFDGLDMGTLRKVSDLMKQKAKSAVLLLASKDKGAANILVSVTDDLVKKDIKANEIIAQVAAVINGSGGGRPQLAQAGSKDAKHLDKAINEAKKIIKNKL